MKLLRREKPPAKLCRIHAIFRRFASANENYRDIPPIAFFQRRILVNVHFVQRSAKLGKQRRNHPLCFLAKMTARPAVKSNLARAGSDESQVLRMFAHGFGFEYF